MKFWLFWNIFVNTAQKHFVFKSLNEKFHYLSRDSKKSYLFDLLYIKIMSFNVIDEKLALGYFCTIVYIYIYIYDIWIKGQTKFNTRTKRENWNNDFNRLIEGYNASQWVWESLKDLSESSLVKTEGGMVLREFTWIVARARVTPMCVTRAPAEAADADRDALITTSLRRQTAETSSNAAPTPRKDWGSFPPDRKMESHMCYGSEI